MRLICYSSAIAATVFICSVSASNKYIQQTQNAGLAVYNRNAIDNIAPETTSGSEALQSQTGNSFDSETESETEDEPDFAEARERILADLEEKFRRETKPRRNKRAERRMHLSVAEFMRLYQYIKNVDPNDAEATRAQAIRDAVGVNSKKKVRYVRDMFMEPRAVHHSNGQ